jgi:hypothetical protein
MNSPKVYFDNGDLIVVLIRKDKEELINLGQFRTEDVDMIDLDEIDLLQIRCTKDINEINRLKLDGPPDKDGFTHYIYGMPAYDAYDTFGIFLTKEEADIIPKKIADAMLSEYGVM